ncbi:MAG: class I SAM-dependent RNA methyltransferase [Nitrospirota bacterium]|nr:class I SAM-dependent RNA methyltransferase [Nitrospirota bacterium]
MKKSRILITCSKGIPPILSQELAGLGFPVLAAGNAGVETEGDMRDAMVLNLRIRTGHRVLVELAQFRAAMADELYRGVKMIPWETFIPADGYLCVTSSVQMESIRDQRFASLKCKDAIVDRIKERQGRRPDSGPERDRTVVHLYWAEGRASLYLDTSGEPLSRRGYRKIPMAAPMQETLAAGVVLATGWSGEGSFVNPMTGSGTLAIEAALIGLNRAPGLLRTNFGFMHLLGHDETQWKLLRDEARKAAKKELGARIIATDIDPAAVDAAKKNALTAGVDHLIEFKVCDFAETDIPAGGGAVVMNPEYGERMGEIRQLEGVYEAIGDFLKQKCQGYRGYVFTGNPGLAKKIGLKSKRKIPFWNSGIECRLLEYDIYLGTKRELRKPE